MTADPSDLSKVTEGAYLASLLPYLEGEVERQENLIIRRVIGMHEKGELTPDGALSAWMELIALRKLLKGLDTRVRVGQSAAERVAPEM